MNKIIKIKGVLLINESRLLIYYFSGFLVVLWSHLFLEIVQNDFFSHIKETNHFRNLFKSHLSSGGGFSGIMRILAKIKSTLSMLFCFPFNVYISHPFVESQIMEIYIDKEFFLAWIDVGGVNSVLGAKIRNLLIACKTTLNSKFEQWFTIMVNHERIWLKKFTT